MGSPSPDSIHPPKDEIGEVEWGFNDEYQLCDDCSSIVIRTSPDSYGWTLEAYRDEEGYLYCESCAQSLQDDCISRTQDKIDNGEEPISYPDIFKIGDDWRSVDHPVYNNHLWESGLHPGQNDSPLKQGKIVRSIRYNNTPIFQIIYRIYPSQFDISWDALIRVDPDSDITLDNLVEYTGKNIDDWLEYFGIMFNSPEGRTRYDYATLMSTALQSTTGNFNKISVDPENGTIDIKTYDSPEDMYR